MGGGNAQKSATARLKNMKDKSATPEERKAATAKTLKDCNAFVCKICKATFMVNVKPPTLYLHVTSKHPSSPPVECFDALIDFDPEDPKGLKKAATAAAATAATPTVKKSKKPVDSFDLLSAGLKPKKGSKK
jgi:hypothetical protein